MCPLVARMLAYALIVEYLEDIILSAIADKY
jgi:hypothetical protein